jgi:NitT/TauT family transport system substrate-binding protein
MRRNTGRAFVATVIMSSVLFGFGVAQGSTAKVATRAASARGVLVSPAQCKTNRAAGAMTFVSPFGYDASAGIIDIFAAKELGYFAALCIDVNITSSYTPYILVSSGRAQVTGEGSAADDLLEVAHGANLVATSTFGDTSDYALLTAPTIANLRQLGGKTLGYHTSLPVVISEMLARAGISQSAVTLVNDTSYDPTLLTQGKFQALQAYQSNEPLELEADGYKIGKDFKEWLPSSFGVQGTFNVQVVNGTFLTKHESTVADFLRAELKAVAFCVAHGPSCVTIEQQAAAAAHVSYDRAHALAEWKFETGLVQKHSLSGQGFGVQSYAEWQSEYHAVLAYKLVSHLPALAKVEDVSLVASLYHAKTLIWP